VRGLILSGAPFYPSTLGHISLEWAAPVFQLVQETIWILSWAREPYVHWREVLGSWSWLYPWSQNSVSLRLSVLYPVCLFLGFSAIAVILSAYLNMKKRIVIIRWEWWIFIPIVMGLLFWFFTAPDPRFAHALFFLTSIGSIALFL